MRRCTRIIQYAFLSVASFISVFPFFWVLTAATNTSSLASQGRLWFGNQLFVNIKNLIALSNVPVAFWNSTKIALGATVLTLLCTSLAAYGFQMFPSKLRERIYALLLLSMMIPFAALMIPLYRIVVGLGLHNNAMAIVLPAVANVFLIFFFRQNFKSFPTDIISAARIDGAGEFAIFFKIVMPSMKSTYAAAAIYSFMANWNNYIWPLIVLQSDDKNTLTLMLSSLSSSYTPDYGVISLGVLVATFPMLVLFCIMQKHFVQGMVGSIK